MIIANRNKISKLETKKGQFVLGLVFSIVLFSSLYSSQIFTDPYITSKHFFTMLGGSLSLIVGLLYFYFKKKNLVYRLNLLDFAVLAFGVYLVLHDCILGNLFFNNMNLLNILYCIVLYFIFSPLFKHENTSETPNQFIRTIIGVIILIGLIQVFYGFFGYINSLQNSRPELYLGGAFGNPGPYSNFLVTLLPVSLISALKFEKGFLKYGGIFLSVLILITLPLTLARTAWIGAAFILGFVSFLLPVVQQRFKRLLKKRFSKLLIVISFIIFVVFIFIALISFKKDSVNGRLFIWEVSTKAILDQPIFGYGYSSFPYIHNKYQAQYFNINPVDKQNSYLADSVDFAFNDYIQFLLEIGVFGLFLFLAIVFLAIRCFIYKNKDENLLLGQMGFGVMTVVLVLSIFSYPLRSTPITFLFFLSLLFLNSGYDQGYKFAIQIRLSKYITIFGILLVTLWFGIYINRLHGEKEWNTAYKSVRENKFEIAKHLYRKNFSRMTYNPYFNYNYGAELCLMGDFEKSISILKTIEYKLADSDFYILLGSNYEALGKFDQALSNYEHAANMIPMKYYPKYKMVMLNERMGNTGKAIELSKQIIDMPIKVDSKTVRMIREEISLYLNNKGELN